MFFLSNPSGDNRGMIPLAGLMNDLFAFADSPFGHSYLGFKADVEELDDKFLVKAELPGVDPKKIDLELTPNRMTISAIMSEEKEFKNKHYVRRERSYGTVTRSFDFGSKTVKVNESIANYKDGILTIELPKENTSTAKAKKIPVNA